jgi:putative toxin-antitoxin system antitoxin component (TIGR02293 family)
MTELAKKAIETKKIKGVVKHHSAKRSDSTRSMNKTGILVRKVGRGPTVKIDKLMQSTSREAFAFLDIYSAQPYDRIKFIKKGVPAKYVVLISKSMGVTKEKLFRTLGLPKSTVDKKISHNQVLPPDQGERVLGLAKLVGQVEEMVNESGNPEGFDAAEWVASWIATPSPALGGVTPASYMDTAEGQEIVSGLIAKMQSGAYA